MLATKDNVAFMREAELKHGRVCMLASLGFVATDLGFRLPGEQFAGLTSVQAHDAMVKSGAMFYMFLAVALIETISFTDTLEMLMGGSSKTAGDFGCVRISGARRPPES